MQSFSTGGGLVVAAVIKYADNILKSFATAVSIVTSTIVSMLVFGFMISELFVGGSLLVFVAVGVYSRNEGSGAGAGGSGSGAGAGEESEISMSAVDLGKKRASGISSSSSSDDGSEKDERELVEVDEENVSLLRKR